MIYLPKISVIIPIYKAERFINNCLDSVVAQTYDNWEAILVDDGSPDESGRICDKYAKMDSRFRVFHKPNGGVSSARNWGLDNAKGEWVLFVDADDILLPNAIELCVRHSNDVEMVCCGLQPMQEDGRVIHGQHSSIESFVILSPKMAELILTYQTICGPFCKLIKRNVIGNIRFEERLHKGEDAQFLVSVLISSDFDVYFCSDIIYKYRLLQNSLSHGNSTRQIMLIHSLIDYLKDRLNDKNIIQHNLNAAVSYSICSNVYEIVREQGLFKNIDKDDLKLFKEHYMYASAQYEMRTEFDKLSNYSYRYASVLLTLDNLVISIKKIIREVIR